jgi:peptidoglycan/xylan/chitin deacetylase (PgdA/CDA1 family)
VQHGAENKAAPAAADINAASGRPSGRYHLIPDFAYPSGTRLAVNFCVAYDVMIKRVLAGEPPMERTQGEFGGRVGVWRLLELFDRHGVKATFFTPGRVCELYPRSLEAIAAGGHEIAAMPWEKRIPAQEKEELDHLRETTTAIAKAAGKRPAGFSGLHKIHLLRAEGYRYRTTLIESAAETPYYIADGEGNALLNLPGRFPLDDAMYFHFGWMGSRPGGQHLADPEQVFRIWLAAFRAFYRRGTYMRVLVHPFVSGRALRIAMLERLIVKMKGFPGLWFPTCAELADYCLARFPIRAG